MGQMERYGHGGDLLTAQEIFAMPVEAFCDFSANINPLGPPQSVIAALQSGLREISAYPDPAHRQLRSGLAGRLGVSPEQLLIGNGAAECMALALLAFAPRKVGVLAPSFLEYARFSERYGAKVQMLHVAEEAGFLPDELHCERWMKANDLVFVGHPNNPTGTPLPTRLLVKLAQWSEEFGTIVIVDEAFIDFIPPEKRFTLLSMLDQYPRVVLIRSMTKFYAIPGLRLGFAVAAPSLIAAMRAKQVTWSVNALSLRAGLACLEVAEYERKTLALIETERSFLTERLALGFAFSVFPSAANFLLVRLPAGLTAETMQRKLGEKGVLIRNCAMYPGLTERDMRIAVKTRADNERLLRAIDLCTNEVAK
ncbi:MAG TPA: threonine-phosphate decarboxylase CobD [Bacilli bacterium]